MHYFSIAFLIAAATARNIPESGVLFIVPSPLDFPRRQQLSHSSELHATGIIGRQGNGEANAQEKPKHHEFDYGNERRIQDNTSGFPDETSYSDGFDQSNDRTRINGPSSQENRKLYDKSRPGYADPSSSTRGVDANVNDRIPQDSEHNGDRNHKCIRDRFKNDREATGRRGESGAKTNKDNPDDDFYQNPPKTNLNSKHSRNNPDANVTRRPIEGRTIENELKGNVTDDKWVWGDTTMLPSTETELDNRAAFDGGVCPTGQIRIKGSDMCVDKDEDK
ncbi:uncharacterized protein LOC106140489 [Amyelois transitella]|uniref:uncharacterized protein LOC106140489 n=1 Tax=Amyelois transitella TaxID=680683 RepID=UPI00298FE061|nr:uncharacterized protein LOC106140489 [Amyelois transitella]